jgi:hypothetical protein
MNSQNPLEPTQSRQGTPIGAAQRGGKEVHPSFGDSSEKHEKPHRIVLRRFQPHATGFPTFLGELNRFDGKWRTVLKK